MPATSHTLLAEMGATVDRIRYRVDLAKASGGVELHMDLSDVEVLVRLAAAAVGVYRASQPGSLASIVPTDATGCAGHSNGR